MIEQIKPFAERYDIRPELIQAIIQVESSGNTYAVRFEPGYKWLHEVENSAQNVNTTIETERVCQQMSWGLMQLMGATARWLGFKGPIPELTYPHFGIEWGCKYLRNLFYRYHKEPDVIAAYNAGSPRFDAKGKYVNQAYVDKVLKLI